jgi:hypothetical protein
MAPVRHFIYLMLGAGQKEWCLRCPFINTFYEYYLKLLLWTAAEG